MLQLYDSKKNKIAGLTKYNYLCIEDTLLNGDSTLTFSYARNLPFYDLIQEEGYIRTKDNEYVIKERTTAQEWDTFKCVLNVEDLEGSPFDRFESIEKTINEALNLALTNSKWTVLGNNLTKKRTVRSTNNSAWEIIQDIKKTYRVDLKFDSILKKIHVYENLGENKGAYFIEDLNLKTLDVQINTFNFYTRLIAIGKDGMTIESINNNKKYVENYQYSDKIKTLYWSDDRYTVKESLKEDAEAKLNDLSKPRCSYNAMIANLAKFSQRHASILNYKIGDTITLISKDKKIRDTQRIVKITTFPLNHDQDSVELSNTMQSFEDIQQNFEETTETLKNVMLDNGTIDGRTIDSISIKQIKEWNGEDPNPPGEGPGIVGNFNTLNATKINTNHIIAKLADITDTNIVTAKIGRAEITDGIITNLTSKIGNIEVLTVGKLSCTEIDSILGKFEVLESNVAHINHILAGNITSEHIQAGTIVAGSGIIAEGAIGDAQISSLNANKIRAGTIDTSLVNVSSSNGEIQITGYQILVNDTTNALDKKNRVILGKYIKGDAEKYGLLIRGADGQTVMWDETGVHNAGITDGSIDNNKISDDANIEGYKLNINSVIRTINKDGTEVISGTRVQVGNKTLEVELSEQKNLITDNKTELSNQRSQIIANTEAIKLKVDNQTFTETTTQITQDTINKINAAKTELKGEISDVNNSLSSLESTMNGAFKDGIIEETEAIAIKEQINQIDKEKLDLDKQYDLIYADTDLPIVDKKTLKTLKDDFNSKHLGLKNEITAAITDKRITPEESKNINNRIKLYSTSLSNLNIGLQKALDIIVKNKINTAKESAIAEANRKINEAKGQLQTEINDVNKKVIELTGNIDTVIKDNFISEAEALILENDIKQLDKEKADLDKQYTTIYTNANLENPVKTNLYNAYNDYSNKHNQLKEAIKTAIANKNITEQEKNNINTLTTTYSKALALLSQRLNESIDNIVNNKANATLLEALNKINEAKGQLQTEINDVNKKVDELVLNMDSVIKDGIIDEAEALILENDIKQLDKEKLDLNKKFDVIYANVDLTGTAKINLNTAHTDFNTKHKILVDKIREVIANKKVSDAEKTEINTITTSYSSSVAVLAQRFEEAVDAIVTKKSANTLAQAIAKINEAKEQLNNEIKGVGDSLQNLDNEIHGSFKDGIISEAECIEIKGKIQTLEIEKKDVQKQYDSIYNNSVLIGNAKINLYNSKVDYDAKYTELINAINSSIADKIITSQENTNVNNKITVYGNSLALLSQRLNEALDFIVSKKADNALLQAIEKINQAKSELKTEIGQVDSTLGNLNNEIHGSFKDGIINEAETLAIKEQIKSLDIEKEDVISKYNNLYTNTDLTGIAKTNLYNAKVDFETKHNALKESINAAILDNKATTTEKNDIDAKTKAYSISLATFSKRMNEAIDAIAQKKSANAILSSNKYTDGQVTIVDTKLEKATSEIKILKEEINLKVSQTTVNNIKAELDNKISANSTKISENKSEIILTKESIKQQVSSLNSQITTVENNLNNTITKVNTVNNKVATLETNLNGITAKVENVEIKVEQTGNKLDNLKTGGRNLVKNSGNFKNLDFWTGNATLENSEIKASGILKNNSLIKLEANKEYIYSIEFKPSRNMNITETSLLGYELVSNFIAETMNNCNINNSNYSAINPKTTSKGFIIEMPNQIVSDNIFASLELLSDKSLIANKITRVILKLKTKSNLNSAYRLNPKITETNSFNLKNMQFEEGNKDSPWKPSDEDIKKDIDDAKNLLQIEINDINTTIVDLDKEIKTSFKDNLLDESEKQVLRENLNRITKEKADVDAKYTTIYNNKDLLGIDKINLANAKTSFDSSYNALKSAIDTILNKTNVSDSDAQEILQKNQAYARATAELSKKLDASIDSIATQKSNSALSEAIKKINESKELLQSSINNVKNSVTSLDNTMNNAFKDSVISESESLAIKEQISIIDREKADLDKKYNNLYTNADLISTAKTNLYNAKNSYNTNHTNLKNSINSAIADKNITTSERTDINNKLSSYSTSLSTLSEKMNEAINAIATKKANDALNSANSHTDGQVITINNKISGIIIEQNKINSTVSDVQIKITNQDGKIENLQTGSQNYILNSSKEYISTNPPTSNYYDISHNCDSAIKIKKGNTYTMTLYLESKENNVGSVYAALKRKDNSFVCDTTLRITEVGVDGKSNISHTFVAIKDDDNYIMKIFLGHVAQNKKIIAKAKLELGKESSDWSPNLIDLKDKITEVSSKMSNIEQTNSSITSSVNELKVKTDGLNTKVVQHSSQITQLSDSITQKVSVGQVESMIQQTESKVNFKFTHNGAINLIRNGRPRNTLKNWYANQYNGNATIRKYVGGN